MPSTLFDPKVKRVLNAMHSAADENDPPLLARARGKEGTARTSILGEAFIPVSRDGGRLVYTLVRGAVARYDGRIRHVVRYLDDLHGGGHARSRRGPRDHHRALAE